MYNKLKKKNLSINEIEIRLKDNGTFLPTILVILTLIITIGSLIYNSSVSISNTRYEKMYTQGSQQVNIALKAVDFDQKNNQLNDVKKLLEEAQDLNSKLYDGYLEHSNQENQKYLVYFIALVALLMLLILLYTMRQLRYKDALYKLLHEKEQLLSKQKMDSCYPMFYID